ncbi:unnamed protein product [Camellia sinensis]
MENTEKEITSDEPKYRGLKAMPFVIGNETFEKLGTLGTSSNLLVYLTTVFNMDTITSTNLINIFNGTCNFGTLLGAFLSDTYFGRYKTLGFASISSFLGYAHTDTHSSNLNPSSPPLWIKGVLLMQRSDPMANGFPAKWLWTTSSWSQWHKTM